MLRCGIMNFFLKHHKNICHYFRIYGLDIFLIAVSILYQYSSFTIVVPIFIIIKFSSLLVIFSFTGFSHKFINIYFIFPFPFLITLSTILKIFRFHDTLINLYKYIYKFSNIWK